MSFASALAGAWWKLREDWAFAGIVNAQRVAGSSNPVLDANREVFFRAEYLERYRDYATARYMKGHDLKSSATEFIKRHLMAGTTIMSAGDTAALRSVIRGMSEHEAFHPEAANKYRSDLNKALAEINAQAKLMHGLSGRSPVVTRVLRGHG